MDESRYSSESGVCVCVCVFVVHGKRTYVHSGTLYIVVYRVADSEREREKVRK